MKEDHKERIIAELTENEDIEIREDELMKRHTWLRIGGPADLFLIPDNREAFIKIIKKLNRVDMPYHILGSGSNILVADRGIRGAVISLLRLDMIEIRDEKVTAQAGCSLAELAEITAWHGLAGLEFASGIPGTLGGAIYMNAGAYGGEMKDVLERVEVLDLGEEKTEDLPPQRLGLDYRTSRLQSGGMIALTATIKLQRDDPAEILDRIAELECRRWFKQPLTHPSAGSAFKRPENDYAGRLIEAAGLKGKKMGGAQVSPKHAGFIINRDKASAEDVLQLMKLIRRRVKEKFDITLEPEPRPLGDFDPEQLDPLFPDGTAV